METSDTYPKGILPANSSTFAISIVINHEMQLLGFVFILFYIPFLWFFHDTPFSVLAVQEKLEDA